MTISTDAELISTSLSGNNEAFVELVERHEAAVWAYLVRRAGRQVAEDLLAEVWTGAYASRRRYDLSFPEARPWQLQNAVVENARESVKHHAAVLASLVELSEDFVSSAIEKGRKMCSKPLDTWNQLPQEQK